MVKPLDELTDQMNRHGSHTCNKINSFQKTIVPSCRLLEWCYLLAFSFCHRQLQITPQWTGVSYRTANGSGMPLEWTLFEFRGFLFKQLELHLPLVFSFPAYMQLQACWSNLPGKKAWTGGKKTNRLCMIAAIVTCILMPLVRLSFPSLANSRCLLKSVRKVTRAWW